MFQCGTCWSRWRCGWPAEVRSSSSLPPPSISLVLLLLLPGGSGDAAVAPLAGGAAGPLEGRLVCVLLGMHLVVQEVAGELGAVLDLQLGNSGGD